MIAMMGFVIAILLGTDNTFGEFFHCYAKWDLPNGKFAQHMMHGKTAAKVAAHFAHFRFIYEDKKGLGNFTVAQNGLGRLPVPRRGI